MSDTMLERVARAIANRADDEFEPNREFWIPYARAAISAMREPTKEMVDAGMMGLSVSGVDSVEDFDAVACFQAMIDAALSEAQSTGEKK